VGGAAQPSHRRGLSRAAACCPSLCSATVRERLAGYAPGPRWRDNGAASTCSPVTSTRSDEWLSRSRPRRPVKRLPVDYASHSAAVETIRERLLADLAGVRPRAGEVPFYSTVTGKALRHSVSMPVLVHQSAPRRALRADTRVLLAAATCLHRVQPTLACRASRRRRGGRRRRDRGGAAAHDGGLTKVVDLTGEAFVRGVAVDWRTAFPGPVSR